MHQLEEVTYLSKYCLLFTMKGCCDAMYSSVQLVMQLTRNIFLLLCSQQEQSIFKHFIKRSKTRFKSYSLNCRLPYFVIVSIHGISLALDD